jgi:hypothetical protein
VDAVQFITIQDTTDPAFDYVPGDVTVDLNAGESTDPSETGTAEASDACGDINVTYSDQVTPGGENTQIITRTWTATDGCGNSSSALQILTVLGEQHAISLSPLFELLLGR